MFTPFMFRGLASTSSPAPPSIKAAHPTCSSCHNTPGQPNVYSFFESNTNTWQYVVTDPSTKKAVIVDPVLDFYPASGAVTTKTADGLLAFVRENGYEIVMLLETHAHADHLTAAHYLKKRLGGIVPVGIGKRIVEVQERFGKVYDVPRKWWDGAFDKYFDDEERFKIGDLECQVIHLPGHTPDHIGYVCGDGLFLGDTLFYVRIVPARSRFNHH